MLKETNINSKNSLFNSYKMRSDSVLALTQVTYLNHE